jgi:hypothetical protein
MLTLASFSLKLTQAGCHHYVPGVRLPPIFGSAGFAHPRQYQQRASDQKEMV